MSGSPCDQRQKSVVKFFPAGVNREHGVFLFASFSAAFASFCSISFSSFLYPCLSLVLLSLLPSVFLLLFLIRVFIRGSFLLFHAQSRRTLQQRFARTAGRQLIGCGAEPRDKKSRRQRIYRRSKMQEGRKEGRKEGTFRAAR